MHSKSSATDFGYKIQALSGHVLLRLGYQVSAVNQSGHPDIIAGSGGTEYRFEVEAEVTRPRLRKLTVADFNSLVNVPNVIGYYALAITFPSPRWILVQASKLVNRKSPSPNILLETLSDKGFSAQWTTAYLELLHDSCKQISLGSFNGLRRMAESGVML
jgi:Holliday junction resolvase